MNLLKRDLELDVYKRQVVSVSQMLHIIKYKGESLCSIEL